MIRGGKGSDNGELDYRWAQPLRQLPTSRPHCILGMDLLRWANTKWGLPNVKFQLFPTAVALALLLGCSSTPEPSAPTGQIFSGTDEQLFLDDSVEKNYDPHVIMKRAETFFDEEAYPEAIVEYQHFLDMHRTHILAPYAQYKLGESHFNMAKSVDRDPEPIKKARESFEKLLTDYPGSKHERDALAKIRDCRNWLAETNFFVGQFYYRQGAFLAAAHRFESIVQEEPGLEVAPEALYYLALTYKEIGADDWAREKLIMLAQQYPNHTHEKDARELFVALNGSLPDLEMAQSLSTPSTHSPLPVVSLKGYDRIRSFPVGFPQSNGANHKTPAQRTITPVTVSGGAPTVSPSSGTTVCRLGTWC